MQRHPEAGLLTDAPDLRCSALQGAIAQAPLFLFRESLEHSCSGRQVPPRADFAQRSIEDYLPTPSADKDEVKPTQLRLARVVSNMASTGTETQR
jgi:hypothetical protein